jgi:hypothetical protein
MRVFGFLASSIAVYTAWIGYIGLNEVIPWE